MKIATTLFAAVTFAATTFAFCASAQPTPEEMSHTARLFDNFYCEILGKGAGRIKCNAFARNGAHRSDRLNIGLALGLENKVGKTDMAERLGYEDNHAVHHYSNSLASCYLWGDPIWPHLQEHIICDLNEGGADSIRAFFKRTPFNGPSLMTRNFKSGSKIRF